MSGPSIQTAAHRAAHLRPEGSLNDAESAAASESFGLTSGTAVMAEAEKEVVMDNVSVGQKMLSAVSGSLATSLLATPLDVVRVRLQSQPPPAALPALRTSSLNTAAGKVADLGVTACCREVFWVNNQAQYCIAPSASATVNSSGALGTFSSPSHITTTSIENCSVEEARRKTFTSTFDGLRKIARNEGFTTLWRGLSPTLVMAIPANVIYFTGYDYLRFSQQSPVRNLVPDSYAPLVAGSIARVAAAITVGPIEMFRTRMQASSGSSATLLADTARGMRDVVRAQGYTSLWRGLTLTMWRDVPFSGIYWWGYEQMRNVLTDAREGRWGRGRTSDVAVDGSSRARQRSRSRSCDNLKTTFIDSVIAGATSGAVASVFTMPFDVGKTRQQVFVHGSDGAGGSASSGSAARQLLPEERSMPRFLYHILRTEGLPGLFKGGVARCLKVAPACAIMISSYEVGKKTAQRANERGGEKVAVA